MSARTRPRAAGEPVGEPDFRSAALAGPHGSRAQRGKNSSKHIGANALVDTSRRSEIEIDGLHIAYRRAGEGEPLVLVHGGPSNSRDRRAQLAGLSDEFTVVAWDMPGCGRSADPPWVFAPRDC